MAKGPKPQRPEIALVKGTAQPCRDRVVLFPDLPGNVERPKWLTGEGKKAWDRKVAVYVQRGQAVVGCEDALAQYCALEAELIQAYRRKNTPSMAMVSAHRIYACEFYDTPASQVKTVKNSKPGNKFTRNGK